MEVKRLGAGELRCLLRQLIRMTDPHPAASRLTHPPAPTRCITHLPCLPPPQPFPPQLKLESPYGDELPAKGFDPGMDTYQAPPPENQRTGVNVGGRQEQLTRLLVGVFAFQRPSLCISALQAWSPSPPT